MTGAGREGVEHACGEDESEGQSLVARCQVGIMPMEQLVADAHHSNTLACIAKGLRTRDEQHVVVGIAGYSRLIRRLEGHAEVLAEIHSEIGKVLHDDGIVLRSQLTNGAQLVLRQAHPRGVVGVAIDDGTDVALAKIALDFRSQPLTTIVVDIEGLVLHALNLQLHLLHGKAGIDEEDGVLLLVGLRTGEERGKGTLHGAYNRHAALGVDIDADECLDEARSLLFQFWIALNIRILRSNAVLQGTDLCLHAHA